MNNDLISRSELTKELRERLVACNDWEDNAKDKETRIRANAVKAFICEMFVLLKEIPTVEPEPVSERQKRALAIVDALTEKRLINVMERGCLRRSIILEPERTQDESKTVTDCMIAYGDGFESARRLFESKCRDCDFHKFTETFINNTVKVMTKNGIESVEQLSEILGKGKKND